MSRRRANKYWGGGSYGAPTDYFTSGPPRGPREAFLPPQASIDSKFHSDREANHGHLFADDDCPNGDDAMLYHTRRAGYTKLPEEREEVEEERNRRSQARRDVVLVEKARAEADTSRSKFHIAEEDVESAAAELEQAKRDNVEDQTLMEMIIKKKELDLRATQESCISKEANWLKHELLVESAMITADINKHQRYIARDRARERIERVRAGLAMEAAGKALHNQS